jgi:hypothetical protein
MSVLRRLLPRTLVLVVVSPSGCRGCGGVGVGKGTVEAVSDAGWWQSRAACSSRQRVAGRCLAIRRWTRAPGTVEHSTRAQEARITHGDGCRGDAEGANEQRMLGRRIWRFVGQGVWVRVEGWIGCRRRGRTGTGESVCCFFVDAMMRCPGGSRLGNGGHGRKRLEMDAIFFFPLGREQRTVFQSETCGWPTDKAAEEGGRDGNGCCRFGLFFSPSLNRPPLSRESRWRDGKEASRQALS